VNGSPVGGPECRCRLLVGSKGSADACSTCANRRSGADIGCFLLPTDEQWDEVHKAVQEEFKDKLDELARQIADKELDKVKGTVCGKKLGNGMFHRNNIHRKLRVGLK
jgi:hypothetical protein